MADIMNGRCHNEKAPEKGPPLFNHGKLIVQAHDIGWLVTGIFTVASVVISFWLMGRHLRWYTNKAEQRYIVRILLMVPIYSVVSLASYLFWNHSTPLLLLRDCYESTVLTSFFYLLLTYISPDPEQQKDVFRKVGLSRENDRERIRAGEPLKKWMFPFGSVKWKPQDGLYFLQLMKWGVLQYCVIRPTTTLAAVILDYAGLYCEDSWGPGWGHLYISVTVSASVSVAMYCLLQLYMPIREYLASQKPLLKLFAVKAVVFLTFWQATFLSMLATFGLVKDTKYMTADNINIGIGAIMETVEMTLFALLHIKAFSYKPYVTDHSTKRLPSLIHAFNFKETLLELWTGTIYIFQRMRGRETDVMARRQAALENVFGKSRHQIQGSRVAPASNQKTADEEKAALSVRVAVEETMHIGEERQWLGVGDDYAYGLEDHTRRQKEKSDGLGEQIEQELATRGYERQQPSNNRAKYELLQLPESAQPVRRRQSGQSWWRNIYSRLSQSEAPGDRPIDVDRLIFVTEKPPIGEPNRAYKTRKVDSRTTVDPRQQLYDDPPPPSVIRSYRESKSKRRRADQSVVQPAHRQGYEPVVSEVFGPSRHLEPPPAHRESSPAHREPSPAHREPSSAPSPSLPSANSTPYSRRQSLPSTNRSDSFLGRAFPDYSDLSPFSATTSLPSPSSNSHESRVRLSGRPVAVGTAEVASATPRVVHPYVDPGKLSAPVDVARAWHVAHVRDVARQSDSSNARYPTTQTSQPPPVAHASPSTDTTTPRSAPMVKSHLRRDQIVMPAPLAPAASPPVSSRTSERPNFAFKPLPDPSAASQLRRSKHKNSRRYSYTSSDYQTRDRASRRISFPLPEVPIAEDTPLAFPPPDHVPRS